ncbi:hypothetical protein GUITHDRAFT_54093, partial [Guillardia theta CCMP2712]
DTVKMLIRQGADLNETDYDKRTVLHMACAEGNYKIVEMLLNYGADKNCKDRWGNTPLQEAINNKHATVISLL